MPDGVSSVKYFRDDARLSTKRIGRPWVRLDAFELSVLQLGANSIRQLSVSAQAVDVRYRVSAAQKLSGRKTPRSCLSATRPHSSH